VIAVGHEASRHIGYCHIETLHNHILRELLPAISANAAKAIRKIIREWRPSGQHSPRAIAPMLPHTVAKLD
jgi:hypothetical protein